jgi:hypothetical protein
MARFTQSIALGATGLAVFHSAAAYAGQVLGTPHGLTLGNPLGSSAESSSSAARVEPRPTLHGSHDPRAARSVWLKTSQRFMRSSFS